MVVALTSRHFRDLTELTGTAKAVAALAETLDADFTDEGQRYRHRDALTGLFTEWFAAHTGERDHRRAVGHVGAVGAVPHVRRSGHRRPGDGQPAVHRTRPAADRRIPGAGLPVSIDGDYPPAVAAPALGDDTAAVLERMAGLGAERHRRRCTESGTVA